ncbi:hypothetical protein D6T64_19700 [Cryobacterium melibiosiphilum]|uniref:V8-like Glu-specific endopeptidase n=1 Tax=Cryobacterium melibiosiphilum TaxID=995039 RepID=A0A3A5M877_9MICO|nr:hypothetical protein [Cryobacterium melibiosiphilum]RJT85163.1 hypothetical protein D6T64_19700 [Cryobacterium melibiosiphilum]
MTTQNLERTQKLTRTPNPKRTRNLKSGALAAVLVGALFTAGGLLAGGGASAVAQPAAGSRTTDVDQWNVPQAEQGSHYWTPERMQAAAPGDVLVEEKAARKTDEPPQAAAQSARSASPRGRSHGTRSHGSGSHTAPPAVPATSSNHIGKVFFTLQGLDYVCSGNAIVAANENTVATAGHCVSSGPGAYASRVVFVPAYLNGAAPFGQWLATDLFAPTQWSEDGDISYDTGFAVVQSPTGSTLSDTVGASTVAFNQSRGLGYTAYGYPAMAPFNGESLQTCGGGAIADPYAQTQSQGIPCDLTGGSSGGPWFMGGDFGGVQNSNSSFGYGTMTGTMFGPYWGSVIENVYSTASA